jgi:hypothetical protein
MKNKSRINDDDDENHDITLQDTPNECDIKTISNQRLKKIKSITSSEITSSIDTLTPEHRALYDCAVIIMEIITKFPKSEFSYIFMKIFNTLKMKENMSNEKALLEMMKKMMAAMQPQTPSTKVEVTSSSTLVSYPKDKKKDALVQKFTMLNKLPVRVVFAEMVTRRPITSFNEAKDVLAKVFEIPYSDFAGLTRLRDPCKFSFMIEEAALLKYGKDKPNIAAGSLRPWTKDEFENRPIVTIICNKIAENPPRNKAIKESAKKLLNILRDNDYTQPDDFILDSFEHSRIFPAKKL